MFGSFLWALYLTSIVGAIIAEVKLVYRVRSEFKGNASKLLIEDGEGHNLKPLLYFTLFASVVCPLVNTRITWNGIFRLDEQVERVKELFEVEEMEE